MLIAYHNIISKMIKIDYISIDARSAQDATTIRGLLVISSAKFCINYKHMEG